MLPRAERLTKKRDFETVFKNGKSVKNRFLLCRFLANGTPQNRFGFVVSKKISTKATVRNLVRRRLKSLVSRLPHSTQGKDIVLVALPGTQDKTFAETKEVVSEIIHKIS